ncbi:MAG: 1-deoxy-D-xylulose-5-phosphate synthase [Oscillospiraceae bacterium]|jgi:1-deoxy-D-xylulose-5-phosphate synthase|nr:1-deoxy-D-xylulose-5-phosphate synthase [Oscillospiraceae bacterium]
MILDTINSPAELRALTLRERLALSDELRSVIITTVKRQGGHLASNLGAVELTVALHTAMNLPADKLIFDVGHQAYTHKLLTGRRNGFELLRQDGGVSGFPRRDESAYDPFGVGHSSTAVSAALGFARARDLAGGKHRVVAVVGDGALTGGLTYEALNDAGKLRSQLLVVLNDNEMSISRNTGALNEHLTRLRASGRWVGAKRALKHQLDSIPLIGPPTAAALEWMKTVVRRIMVGGEFFESLGFRYLGPVDGHDLESLTDIVGKALRMNQPTVLHAVTRKGKGSPEAESSPEQYHGVSRQSSQAAKQPSSQTRLTPDVRALAPGAASPEEGSCARVIGDTLSEIADSDPTIVAITAAMPAGTGLDRFQCKHPDRFFDVAIAEAHAVTLAAGMAADRLKPVVAVYSTFIQRAVDSIIHDVCLQNLPVTLLIDHTGFVAGDGSTHQGVFDLNILRAVPNLTIWTPSGLDELRDMLREGVRAARGPLMIRYPKSLPLHASGLFTALPPGARWRIEKPEARIENPEARVALLTFGASVCPARKATALLAESRVAAFVVRVSSVKPLDDGALRTLTAPGVKLVTIEEGQRAGGLGGAVAEWCQDNGKPAPMLRLGVDDRFPEGYSLDTLRRGLTDADIARTTLEALAYSSNFIVPAESKGAI